MRACPQCGGTYPVAEGFCPMDGARLRTSHGNSADAAADDPFAISLLGRVLDRRYRLDAIIGLGAMGVVFRATHVLIGKTLAVKVLRREHGSIGDVARRFLLEARVASSLKHPNVVDVSDFGELEEGGAYCVMEHLAGRSLAERIDRDGPIAPDDAIAIALQICHGLTAAHSHGVVHRDLKPDNVFLVEPRTGSEAPVVKLLDFGIARAGPRRITAMGTVLGTAEYMAPEQAMGLDIDHRIDLYALGILVFEMLTASVPFHHADLAQVVSMHVHADPPRLATRRPALAHLQRVDEVVRTLLAKSRDARPATAEAAATALITAIGLDLGRDTAERLQRATIQIGSGLLAETGDAVPRAIPAEPTSWRGSPRSGDGPAGHDPRLVSGPVATIGRRSAARRSSPSPARPVLIATVAAVIAATSTFVAAQWLRERDTEPRPRAPTSVAPPGPLPPARPVSSTSAPRPAEPTSPASSPAVTPVTDGRPSDVASPSAADADGSTSLGKPQTLLERSSTRDDKTAGRRRSKTELAHPAHRDGPTPRAPTATSSPTSGPDIADSAPTHEPAPPPAPDPKPSRTPGDLKDPFPAN